MSRERFERLNRITWFDSGILSTKSVLVIGAGALGNWILPHLVLNGIGHVLIVDRDRVEECNLPVSPLYSPRDLGQPKARVAAARLREMVPGTSIDFIDGDIRWDVGLRWFSDADIVLGAVDSRIARQHINQKAFLTKRTYIDAGIDGQSLTGRIQVFVPRRGPCLECSWYPGDYELIEREYPCTERTVPGVPTTSTIAAAIASLSVSEVLKILLDVDGRLAPGSEIRWDLRHHTCIRTAIPRRKDCLFDHESSIDGTITLPGSVEDVSLDRLFDIAAEHLRTEGTIDFMRDLVTSLVCEECREETPVLRSLGKLTGRELRCRCSGLRHPGNIVHEILRGDGVAELFLGRSLGEIGVPPADIICAHTGTPDSEIYLAWSGEAAKNTEECP